MMVANNKIILFNQVKEIFHNLEQALNIIKKLNKEIKGSGSKIQIITNNKGNYTY